MTEVLVDRAPRVRCYECGSDRIFSLCHHCQRPMCDDHSPPAFRQNGVLVSTPGSAAEEARPASQELAGLRLGGVREAVYHCRDHAHLVRGFPTLWVGGGAGIAALGLVLLFLAASAGLVFLLAGLIVAGSSLALHRLRAASAVRPPLPLVPQVNAVNVVERLAGYVRLEDGAYTSTVESVAGELTVDMSANDGHLVLQAYRRKFGLTGTEPVGFSGGFLMIEGDVGLAFRAGQPSVLNGGTGISLGGDSAADHELFPVDPELPQRESTLTVDYEVQERRRPTEIPLWIVPSLVPGSDRRTLEIDLHWNELGPRRRRLGLAVFDLIALEVPASWGNVEGSAPGRVEIGRSVDRRVIRWKQLKPPTPGARSLTLAVRFERPITEIPESPGPDHDPTGRTDQDGAPTRLSLSGRVEATFNGLLSGVTGVGVYLPGGGAGHRPRTRRRTTVAVTFDASLRSIRYQDERVVPDENHPDDVAHHRNRADEFQGVVPDYRTVAELTNTISADNYYVKSVVEHQPYRDYARGGALNRVWDVTGRLYIGLFPIDFDISLRGEESSTARGSAGKTVAKVTVKGAYAMGTLVGGRESAAGGDAAADLATVEADGPDDDLLTRIEDTWTSLHSRVAQVLADRAGRAIGTDGVPGAPGNLLHGEVLEPRGGTTVRTAEMPDTRTAREITTTGSAAGRVADLRRQRDAAVEALLAGRISEKTYSRINERIEAELNRLESS